MSSPRTKKEEMIALTVVCAVLISVSNSSCSGCISPGLDPENIMSTPRMPLDEATCQVTVHYPGALGLLFPTVNLRFFVLSQTPIVAFDVKKQFKNGPYLI